MALIKCPECIKEISDKANSCPNCGCPIADLVLSGIVRIKIPNNIEVGAVGLFANRSAKITDSRGSIIWEGKHGENASFHLEATEKITINLGKWANPVEGMVEPKKKYALIQDLGMHWKATYGLSEVDVIDADSNSIF